MYTYLYLQVSSKVHNQLLQIADERANFAEQKALKLEREVYIYTYSYTTIYCTIIALNSVKLENQQHTYVYVYSLDVYMIVRWINV